MDTLILTIHIIACVSLIILVLLQSGHEGMGVIFGGSSSSFFGSSGAGGFLSKLTIAIAIVFFVSSIAFTYMDTHRIKTKKESIVIEESKSSSKSSSSSNKFEPKSSVPQESQKETVKQKDTGQEAKNIINDSNKDKQ